MLLALTSNIWARRTALLPKIIAKIVMSFYVLDVLMSIIPIEISKITNFFQ